MHAIGSGVTILEVQQNSDTTYRLWDWDRLGSDKKPRELHVEEGRASTCYGRAVPRVERVPWTELDAGVERQRLGRCEFFAIDSWRLRVPRTFETAGQFSLIAVIEGRGKLTGAGSAARPMRPGDVWLVPAICSRFDVDPEKGMRLVELFHHD